MMMIETQWHKQYLEIFLPFVLDIVVFIPFVLDSMAQAKYSEIFQWQKLRQFCRFRLFIDFDKIV